MQPNVNRERQDMTAERFIEVCFKDRFSLICPFGTDSWAQQNLESIVPLAKVTGILTQHTGGSLFYHYTTAENAACILKEGFKVPSQGSREAENLSFDGGVVYTYPDKDHFNSVSSGVVLEIDYMGPWLQSIYEQDKPEHDIGTCLIYPEFIRSIELHKDLGARVTNYFK